MLTFFLDRSSSTSLYEQLYQNIKKAIELSELKKNEKLPSKRKLASHLKISQTTVETAYMQLLAEGYIKSVPKVGFFVATKIDLPFKSSDSVESYDQNQESEDYLIDFRTNQVDSELFPYQKYAKIAREVILDKLVKNLNRGDAFGVYDFRKSIASILFSYRGIVTKPEQIIIGSGSESLLSIIVMLLGRDKVYAVEDPSYLKNYYLYQAYNVKINTISLDEEGINMQELKKSNTQVVHTTPSHQFPQGIVTTVNRRLELLKWAHADENRYIIEDDYDSEFRFFGNPIPAMKGLDDSGKVIYMNSFSKTLAPGLRISFMILPEKLIKMYREKLSFYSSSVPTINQLTLEEFINRGEYEKHLNRMKTNYKAKRDYLLNLLNNCSFKDIIKIKGEESGLHFLMDIITNKSEEYLLEKAKDKGIRVYGISEYMIRKCSISETKTIVLGYSNLSKEQLMIGVKLLEEAWKNI